MNKNQRVKRGWAGEEIPWSSYRSQKCDQRYHPGALPHHLSGWLFLVRQGSNGLQFVVGTSDQADGIFP